MRARTGLLGVLLSLSMAAANAAVVDPAEPPATPAGGAPEAGIATSTVVGVGIAVGVIAAIAAGGGDDNASTTTTTTTTTTGP